MGVLRIRLHGVGGDGQARIVTYGRAQLGIGHVTVGGAVVAVAIGQEAAGADHVAQALRRLATGLGCKTLLAIAAK